MATDQLTKARLAKFRESLVAVITRESVASEEAEQKRPGARKRGPHSAGTPAAQL